MESHTITFLLHFKRDSFVCFFDFPPLHSLLPSPFPPFLIHIIAMTGAQ